MVVWYNKITERRVGPAAATVRACVQSCGVFVPEAGPKKGHRDEKIQDTKAATWHEDG